MTPDSVETLTILESSQQVRAELAAAVTKLDSYIDILRADLESRKPTEGTTGDE